jgi:TATA-binding protein-associated factor Taf7
MVEELSEAIESGDFDIGVPVASFETEISVAESSSSEEYFTEEDLVFDDGEADDEDDDDENVFIDEDGEIKSDTEIVNDIIDEIAAVFPTWGIALIAVLGALVVSAVGVVWYLNKKMKI